MKVRLQVLHMWEAVRYGDVDYDQDRRALNALIAAVPTEMQFSLTSKRTAKDAWDAIAAARIGSDRARKSTLQQLRKEWEDLAFKPGEDVDDFALRLNTLLRKVVQFGDNTYSEERAVEKLFRCVPEKYKQMARSIESLLDLSTMSIEEAIGRLKVVDIDEPQPSSGPKLLLTREQWAAGQGDKKKGSAASHAKAPRPGCKGVPTEVPAEVSKAPPPKNRSRHKMTAAGTVVLLAIGLRTAGSHDAPRPTSRRQRRRSSQLCSWHMLAPSHLQQHRLQRLFSTSTRPRHTPSSAAGPAAATRSMGGASTPAPPTT